MNEAERLARAFHEIYERLAPEFSYETRKASAVPWEDVPANNKSLMVAVCKELFCGGCQAEQGAASQARRLASEGDPTLTEVCSACEGATDEVDGLGRCWSCADEEAEQCPNG